MLRVPAGRSDHPARREPLLVNPINRLAQVIGVLLRAFDHGTASRHVFIQLVLFDAVHVAHHGIGPETMLQARCQRSIASDDGSCFIRQRQHHRIGGSLTAGKDERRFACHRGRWSPSLLNSAVVGNGGNDPLRGSSESQQ